MNATEIVKKIDILLSRGQEVYNTRKNDGYFFVVNSPLFEGWKTSCLNFLISEFGEKNIYVENFKQLVTDYYDSCVRQGISLLLSIKKDLDDDIISSTTTKKTSTEDIFLLLNKFHNVSRQLRSRYSDRNTLDLTDEYDVQDLLHALLKIYFDDIRPEEWCPSYAGKSSRMDFLLKSEKIVLEVKMTRANLKDKEIGSQLIEDIARYKEHPDCKSLICFVYDPNGYIRNPRGVESDLSKSKELDVKVLIRP